MRTRLTMLLGCGLLALTGAMSGVSDATASAPVVPAIRGQLVVYVPHADDDVLSMGVTIQQQVRAGKDVRVVYYTDGAGTGICAARGPVCTAGNEFHGVPVSDFIAARDHELVTAVEALGVSADHIEIYSPPGGRRRDGTGDVPFATQMLRHYISAFPNATHMTMSWLDTHPDHDSAGVALRDLVAQHAVAADQALFSMARWYWAYDYPHRSNDLTRRANELRATRGYPLATEMLRCQDDECRSRVRQAVQAYHSPTNIGYRSVPTYLDVVADDPAELLHGVDAGHYAARLDPMRATRVSATGSNASVSGVGVVPSVGAYPAPLDNAALLSHTLLGPLVGGGFLNGTGVTVRAYDAAHREVSHLRTSTVAGRFTANLAVPPSVATLTATSDQTQGLYSASGSWKVLRQQVRLVPASRGVRVSGTTVKGRYGQAFNALVTLTSGGRATPGVPPVLRPMRGGGWTPPVQAGPSNGAGHATIHGVLGGSPTWYVTTQASPTFVPPVGVLVRMRVSPTVVGVRPAQAVIHRDGAHSAVVRGRLAGRYYAIPARVLAPTKVRVWLHGGGARWRLLRTVTTQVGGTFSTRVKSLHPGQLRFEVLGRKGVYTHLRTAGTAALR